MAKKKQSSKKKTQSKKQITLKQAKQEEHKQSAKSFLHSAIPFICIVVALFFTICLFVPEACGIVGKALQAFMLGLFGGAAYALPVAIIFAAIYFKRDSLEGYILYRVLFAVFSLLNLATILSGIAANNAIAKFDIGVFYTQGAKHIGGGVFGGIVGYILKACLGYVGLFIVAIVIFAVATIFLVGLTPAVIGKWIKSYFVEQKERRAETKKERQEEAQEIKHASPKAREKFEADIPVDDEKAEAVDPTEQAFEDILSENSTYTTQEEPEEDFVTVESVFGNDVGEMDVDAGKMVPTYESETNEIDPVEEIISGSNDDIISNEGEEDIEDGDGSPKQPYEIPPIDLLNEQPITVGSSSDEIEARALKLVNTLRSFRVETKFLDASHGPTVTRYELEPAPGTKVSSIANRVDDISLAMATTGVRIEAPIPGKAAVGIEVPNASKTSVFLRSLIESQEYTDSKALLNIALGKDVAGKNVFFDLAKMPHLLVAGTTGSGKSVCINTMIMSLLYRFTPDECKIILIDPKQVEFTKYNSLPHLILPVVSDSKKAAGALQWAVNEMEHRYNLMSGAGVRDIQSYNEYIKLDGSGDFVPEVAIFIDEFADLMMTAPDSVEDAVCRLAQKARAAGIHVVIGTQRPSVDVITGLIKANFPSRIALTVGSQIDSRTMIDMAGAEKLVGNGDMLFAPIGLSKPMRVQGAFVSDQEIEKVVNFIKAQFDGARYDDDIMAEVEREAAACGTKKGKQITFDGASDDMEESDPLIKQAIEVTLDNGKAATSLLQRKLSVGYGRAAKIIDQMEAMGIVGPQDGNKPRQLLMTKAEYLEMIANNENL